MYIAIGGNAVDTAFCIIECIESTSVGLREPSRDAYVVLNQNHPNPFSQETFIGYDLKETGHISIEVFDMNGKIMCAPVNEIKDKGHHELLFNSENLDSGIYYYVLKLDGQMQDCRQMLVVR